jgi:hypothetical protein
MTYFLNKGLNNRSLLISIRRVKDSYNKENITEVIIPILIKIRIVSKLRYFITDNASANNIIIKLVLQRLRPNIK